MLFNKVYVNSRVAYIQLPELNGENLFLLKLNQVTFVATPSYLNIYDENFKNSFIASQDALYQMHFSMLKNAVAI